MTPPSHLLLFSSISPSAGMAILPGLPARAHTLTAGHDTSELTIARIGSWVKVKRTAAIPRR